jgi:hypothetical protein
LSDYHNIKEIDSMIKGDYETYKKIRTSKDPIIKEQAPPAM